MPKGKPTTADTAFECDRCADALAYMVAYYNEHGFAPSYRQIGDEVGLESKSTVSLHIRHLTAAGLVKVSGQRGAVPIQEEK